MSNIIQTKLTATPTCYQEYRITHLRKNGCGNKKIFIFQWYSRFTENKFSAVKSDILHFTENKFSAVESDILHE